jgi:hypothetical protein
MAGNISSTGMATPAVVLGIFPSVVELRARLVLQHRTTSSWPRFGECHNPHEPARPDKPGGQDARPFYRATRVASKRRKNAQSRDNSAWPRRVLRPACGAAKGCEYCLKSRSSRICSLIPGIMGPQFASLAARFRVLFMPSTQARAGDITAFWRRFLLRGSYGRRKSYGNRQMVQR